MARCGVRMVIGLVIFTFMLWGHAGRAAAELFPVYDCIRPNVAFWKEIYSKYTTSQGLLHDRQNLAIVYGVVELVDERQAGGKGTNQRRIDEARERYVAILQKLARGERPSEAEEQRVAALFGSQATAADFQAASEQVRFQLGQSNRFREGVIRSGAYLDEMKSIMRSYGVPEDLAYIPHVESSFNYKAYSKAGAAGIWQFTQETGKRYMTVDYAVDERRDPIRSTHAAARYLQRSHASLQCWPSAITSYNYGQAGMWRAQQALGTYDRIFREYNEGWFKFASRNFYPEFLAAREVAKNYRNYFGEIKLLPPARASEIKLTGFMPITELSRRLQVSVETLQEMNPALRDPVFTGQKYVPAGYTLRIPEKGPQQLATLVAALDRQLVQPTQKRSKFYQVRRGDTAGGIAKSHGIELSELIAANQLDRRATIHVGQNLRIPSRDEVVTLTAVQFKRTVAARPAARKVQVAMASLPAEVVADINPPAAVLPPEEPVLEAVQEPAKGLTYAINPAVVSGDLSVEQVVMEKGRPHGFIRVDANETLGHFAEWLRIPSQDLRTLNGMKEKDALRVHQRLKIPLDVVDKAAFEERRYEYHKGLEEDFFTSYRVEGLRPYQIRKGDSIWSLRNAFDVPFWLLKKYNEAVDFNNLKPSQEIMVPVVERTGEG